MSARALWRCLEGIAALPLLLSFCTPTVGAALAGEAAPASPEPIVVSLVLNGSQLADAQLLYREPGRGSRRIWIPEAEATGWRMNTTARTRREFEGVAHVAFCETRDRCFYDDAGALLTITLDHADLDTLSITPARGGADAVAATPSTGGYVNYDLSAWRIGRPGAAALLEGRLYSPHGHGWLQLGGVASTAFRRRTQAQGLWQVDDVERGLSAQVGSIVVPDSTLVPGLPLTGLRIGNNPRLRPLQSNTLRPQIAGLADRAIRADVYLDGLFRQTAQVPYGPFSVEVNPPYPGRGSIDLISTDITGVQTRSSLPYYQAPQMLVPGSTEWSLDLGVPAQDGRFMTSARQWLGSMSVRNGLSRNATVQGQWLIAASATRAALSLDVVDAQWGLSTASLVWQDSVAQPRGQLWVGAGHEILAHTLSAAWRLEQSVNGCAPEVLSTPLTDRLYRPCRRLSTTLGAELGPRWSASATFDDQRDSSGRHSRLTMLSTRYQVGARSQWALSMQHLSVNGRALAVWLMSWSQPLGNEATAQVGVQHREGGARTLQWATQTLPPPDGTAATRRMQAYGSVGRNSSIGARWEGRAPQADWRAETWADAHGLSASAGVSGAIGLAEGRLFSARRIDDAFVVVDVGLPDLPVLLDNREVARTNAEGWAVVTDARAHQANSVGVDVSALPIQYAMPRDQQNVVPASGAGVLARFDVSDGGLAIPVRDAAGRTLPAGAVVRISTQRLPTAVTSRSEVFLERSDRPAQISIEWADQVCRFDYSPQAEPEAAHRCAAR
jgi:outer membrane usher protein